eukprot:TRINITY_DN3678_c0_g1_i2.p1 TRINITY_DN3678_c0_g1~~TRINITY_DN3678_c0_g1_i2.p1  ORF type:complete len:312 (-),score=41.39 TRINITY_DN3678_c0_g1_i2:171-1106(-)
MSGCKMMLFGRRSLAGTRRSFASLPTPTVSHEIRLGWIGTGVMPLLAKGAKLAASPYDLGLNSDVVFSIVGYPKDVRGVILGDESQRGVLAGLAEGQRAQAGVIVDMTTSEPSLATEIYEAARTAGVHAIDAPVSGGDVGAREARLSIMLGGERAVVDALAPLFAPMGKTRYTGPPGSGQHTKMVNQILISTTMIGVVEGLLYGYRAGLDLNEVIAAVGAGAAGSWSINNYGPRIVARNFDPGFFVDHFVKDMEIALNEARQMNLKLPGLELALALYRELQAQGHGRKGTHSLMLALEKLNGVELKARTAS